jgi:hypothetical protein
MFKIGSADLCDDESYPGGAAADALRVHAFAPGWALYSHHPESQASTAGYLASGTLLLIDQEWIFRVLFLSFLYPSRVFADLQSSVQSLIMGVITGIFPALVMYVAAKAGVAYAKNSPDAKDKAEAAAIGAVAVLGINGVWSFIKNHIN